MNSPRTYPNFWHCLALVTIFSLTMIVFPTTYAAAQSTERVSLHSDGLTEGNDISTFPSTSANGRFIAFVSEASNLVDNDTNGTDDIFVHDRTTGETTRVSVKSDGTQSDQSSESPSISADGRYVAFASFATNLVDDDTNGAMDVFVHDRNTHVTTRVSVRSDGTEGLWSNHSLFPSISADGRYVAFSSIADLEAGDVAAVQYDIYLHDRNGPTTTRISLHTDGTEGDGHSFSCSISADGKFVAFRSRATTLVDGDANAVEDIFFRDTTTDETTCISLTPAGAASNGGSDYPSISADGRYVAYRSNANNLVAGDTNGNDDIFVYDRIADTTTRISVDSNGVQGNQGSYPPAISADGRFVTFYSDANNLVAGDTNDRKDVFLHDLTTGETIRVSIHTDESQGDGDCDFPSISADGQFVAFSSVATNLVTGDTNGRADIFVRDVTGALPIVDPGPDTGPAPAPLPGGGGGGGGCFINILE